MLSNEHTICDTHSVEVNCELNEKLLNYPASNNEQNIQETRLLD